MDRIPITGPSITTKEIEYVSKAAASSWYDRAQDFQNKFEGAFADFLGRKFAISLPSCTSAIHLALLSLGVGPGDEVIVPEITWIATAAPIVYVGATPIFADIDEESLCLSADSFQNNLTARTKAVIPVDVYGGIGAMERICELASQKGIAVIEDAAQAIGSSRRGILAGKFGDFGVFSFHGTKTLTTGEGGMLVTDLEAAHERIRFLRDHGRTPGDRSFLNTEVAYKYKMSELQAALGLAQLERIEELIELKRRNFAWYRTELGEIPGLRLNPEPAGVSGTFWLVTLLWDPRYDLSKEQLATLLAEHGIDTRPLFYPLSSLPAFASYPKVSSARDRNPNSYTLSSRGINLPSAMNLTRDQVSYIGEVLRKIFTHKEG